VAYYTELGNAVSDPKEKAFFHLLAAMEQEHFLVLQETKKYLANPGAWFQKA
jgi:rubrerythrin